jgi:hypothetical protein
MTGLPSILADPVPPRGPRDLSTRLCRSGRLSLWFDPRNVLIGLRFAPEAAWVHLVPVLGFRWERRKPDGPGQSQRVPDGAERPAEWMPGRWA